MNLLVVCLCRVKMVASLRVCAKDDHINSQSCSQFLKFPFGLFVFTCVCFNNTGLAGFKHFNPLVIESYRCNFERGISSTPNLMVITHCLCENSFCVQLRKTELTLWGRGTSILNSDEGLLCGESAYFRKNVIHRKNTEARGVITSYGSV